MKDFLQIHPLDSVAVALKPLPGVPAGHKFALRDIAEGEDVIKYGNPIGHATRPIAQGELVDHHNIATNLAGTLDYSDVQLGTDGTVGQPHSSSPAPGTSPAKLLERSTFRAYPRPDGQVGIRNDIWIIPTVGCINDICRRIAERAKAELASSLASPSAGAGAVQTILHFAHNYGCSQLGDDHENTRTILRDMVLHPNAGGVLVVGLGCENNQPREFQRLLGDYDRSRIRFLIAQEVEGDEVQAGVQLVRELYLQALGFQRVAVPLSRLRVGLKCGGSDGFSGLTANPLLGAFSDWLCTQQGGTTILTEVPEMFGAERLLMRRAASEDVLHQIILLINNFKQYFISHGQPVGENPSPGNKAGGISTLEEKALGCTQKSGTSPVVGVLAYGQTLPPPGKEASGKPEANGPHEDSADQQQSSINAATRGLFLLSAPGNDLVASTALAAAGCHLVLFTTGRGTPFSTFVPTLKVSTNSELALRKPAWIDFDAGVLLEDEPMEHLLLRFIACVVDVASGMLPTKAEQNGNADFAIFKNGVTL